ncbi:MAG: hypothetical protein LRY51_08300 [Geovibrio sp.]|nr:hypothetical protein [Geovibrio sp.]
MSLNKFKQLNNKCTDACCSGIHNEHEADIAEPVQSGATVFSLSGLDCADCAAKLEKRIAMMKGVSAPRLISAHPK